MQFVLPHVPMYNGDIICLTIPINPPVALHVNFNLLHAINYIQHLVCFMLVPSMPTRWGFDVVYNNKPCYCFTVISYISVLYENFTRWLIYILHHINALIWHYFTLEKIWQIFSHPTWWGYPSYNEITWCFMLCYIFIRMEYVVILTNSHLLHCIMLTRVFS